MLKRTITSTISSSYLIPISCRTGLVKYLAEKVADTKEANMGWLWSERRGPGWKQGWTEQTLASVSPPPLPLLAIFLIIFLLLFVSSYFNVKDQMQHTVINFNLLLLFLPVLLILLAQLLSKCECFVLPATKAEYGRIRRWDLPWGIVALVVMLLVMVSYQSSFRSVWSPIVWRSA